MPKFWIHFNRKVEVEARDEEEANNKGLEAMSNLLNSGELGWHDVFEIYPQQLPEERFVCPHCNADLEVVYMPEAYSFHYDWSSDLLETPTLVPNGHEDESDEGDWLCRSCGNNIGNFLRKHRVHFAVGRDVFPVR